MVSVEGTARVTPQGPADPFAGGMDAEAATLAEMYRALCKAGIPSHAAAVMLGTMMATGAAAQQEGGDGS